MREVILPGGERAAALGQGTWRMSERPARRAAEIEALRTGVELGMTMIDTAEMSGDGATESLVGEALASVRDDVFLVSKAYPQNAGRGRLERACEASLKRLRTERLDLTSCTGVVPWPSPRRSRAWTRCAPRAKSRPGASATSTSTTWTSWRALGAGCATDQVLYNVSRRGPEFDLLAALAARGVSVMAYSPVEQGRLSTGGALKAVADRHGATPYQVALAWVMRAPGVFAIPKAGDVAHVRENRAAADSQLAPEDLVAIDAEFPPPARRTRLEML